MFKYAFISKICAFVQKYAFMFEICIYMRFGKCCSRGAVSLGLFKEHEWLPIKNMQICVYMRNPSSDDEEYRKDILEPRPLIDTKYFVICYCRNRTNIFIVYS